MTAQFWICYKTLWLSISKYFLCRMQLSTTQKIGKQLLYLYFLKYFACHCLNWNKWHKFGFFLDLCFMNNLYLILITLSNWFSAARQSSWVTIIRWYLPWLAKSASSRCLSILMYYVALTVNLQQDKDSSVHLFVIQDVLFKLRASCRVAILKELYKCKWFYIAVI